jgi:ABC-type transporter Mla maintaining outer membrane lipid asymmetry ATPase subunit MlaF
MNLSTAALEVSAVSKNYGALRPLRVQALVVQAGERVAITGLDGPAAELFVNLVTGAALPDEGEIRILGQCTAEIATGDEWLASLDRFGLVSPRAVLLEGATLVQNLALPFTLEIDPVPPDIGRRIVTLAEECGIAADVLDRLVGELPPALRARLHLARAIALDPALLLLEHPTATIPESDRRALAADVVRVCEARSLTMVAITADPEFAAAIAHRSLVLQPATGALVLKRRGWLW